MNPPPGACSAGGFRRLAEARAHYVNGTVPNNIVGKGTFTLNLTGTASPLMVMGL